jgi:hypothetical protein
MVEIKQGFILSRCITVKLHPSTSDLGGTMPFRITPPRQITLVISVALVIIALIIRFAGLELPQAINHPFGVVLLGYLVLLAGNLLEGV